MGTGTATTFLLVRHAEHDLLGKVLTGRMPGVGLGPVGRRQAQFLARHFREAAVTAVQSSPRERARQTAEPIAAGLSLACETAAGLDEIDFGAWTGKGFDELAGDPAWRRWNEARAAARCPGGESMLEAQARLLAHLDSLCAAHPGGVLVLVSHADMIKAALLHVLGASLDAIHRIEIAPASVSTLVLGDWGGKVVAVNQRIAA